MRRTVVAVSAPPRSPSRHERGRSDQHRQDGAEEESRRQDESFTGTPGSAGSWGEVQITSSSRKPPRPTCHQEDDREAAITSVKVPVYPNHTNRSVVHQRAGAPVLIQETVQAQSSGIDMSPARPTRASGSRTRSSPRS